MTTALGVAVAMTLVAVGCSLWWARRPSRERLTACTGVGVVVAVGVWMLGSSVGAELHDGANTGLGLLLLVLTVGSILQARHRLASTPAT